MFHQFLDSRPGVRNGRPAAAGAVIGRAIACGALLALAAGAGAEKADRDKPVNLEADKVTIDDAKQIAHFEGNVLLTQGTLQIRGSRMEVRQDKDGFQSGVTWGKPAYFRQKREGFDEYIEGWAERIEYDGRAELMQMFDRAELKQLERHHDPEDVPRSLELARRADNLPAMLTGHFTLAHVLSAMFVSSPWPG